MKENNCSPGYRWTEADVGTSAISLTIELMQPLQIAEDEHYMESSIKYTCSACPVFGHEGCLVGILALTGLSDKVGIHTLGMVITSAAAMENQLYLTHALQEIEIQNNYLTETIGSLDNAIILIDNSGLIRTMNNSVKKLLHISQNEDISTILFNFFRKKLQTCFFNERHINFKEIFINKNGTDIQLVLNANPVANKSGE